MNVDQFIARNEASWKRLDALVAAARSNVRSLSPGELQELLALYQRTSAHLSDARNAYANHALQRALTARVAAAHSVIYGKRPRTLRSVGRFFTETFPAAVWHDRRFVLASALLFFVPALVVGAWVGTSQEAFEQTADEHVREAYLEEDFEAYYSSEPAAQFATEVTVNNIQVAILAFALGMTLCLGTVFVMVNNGVFLGTAAGLFVFAGEAPKFFGLILPHGLLEISAIVVAGAAGLRLGWTIIDPGDRTRAGALAEEGRRSVVIVLGLVLAFVVAGFVEGFVTGSGLPTAVRVGIGVGVFLTATLWIVVQGRAAAARGVTGLLGETDHVTWDDLAPPELRPTRTVPAADVLVDL